MNLNLPALRNLRAEQTVVVSFVLDLRLLGCNNRIVVLSGILLLRGLRSLRRRRILLYGTAIRQFEVDNRVLQCLHGTFIGFLIVVHVFGGECDKVIAELSHDAVSNELVAACRVRELTAVHRLLRAVRHFDFQLLNFTVGNQVVSVCSLIERNANLVEVFLRGYAEALPAVEQCIRDDSCLRSAGADIETVVLVILRKRSLKRLRFEFHLVAVYGHQVVVRLVSTALAQLFHSSIDCAAGKLVHLVIPVIILVNELIVGVHQSRIGTVAPLHLDGIKLPLLCVALVLADFHGNQGLRKFPDGSLVHRHDHIVAVLFQNGSRHGFRKGALNLRKIGIS